MFRIAEPGSCCQPGAKPRSDSWFGFGKSSGGYGGLNGQEGLQGEEAMELWKEEEAEMGRARGTLRVRVCVTST